MTAILPSRRRLCLPIILFRLGAILLAALIMQTVLKGGQFIAKALLKAGPDAFYVGWIYLCLAIVFQGLLAFIGILIMRRTLPQAEDHVRWPPGRSYAGLAVLIGLGMGLTMLVVDYAPALLSSTAPDASYDLSSVPAAGVLFGMLTTGFAEETLFRGLLVGMLAVLVPGRVRLAGIPAVSVLGRATALHVGLGGVRRLEYRLVRSGWPQQLRATAAQTRLSTASLPPSTTNARPWTAHFR